MIPRHIPDWVRHSPGPSLHRFAALAALDGAARAIVLSVYPLVVYRALGDPSLVSEVYLAAGAVALAAALMTPWLLRFLPRRWTFTLGVSLYFVSASLAIHGGAAAVTVALILHAQAGVIVFLCLNAYVLDYVVRVDLSKVETLRMFYSAFGWTAGPVVGVWLMQHWPAAPFLISVMAASGTMAMFWWLRLGNGKVIRKSRGPAPNPLAYLGRFFAQRRLVAGLSFAMLKSCGWWVYIVYLPIYAIENGLPETLGGLALSASNGLLFATPLMLAWMQRNSVRRAVRAGFLGSGVAFAVAGIVGGLPWFAVVCLAAGSVFLVLLDISGGLPFLMAVKPSERSEMSAVYSSYANLSGIVTPGAAWLVLLVGPLPGIFVAAGAGLLAAWAIAGSLHPRLGQARAALTTG